MLGLFVQSMWYSLLPDQLVSAHACTTLPNACAGAGVAIASTSKEEPFLTVSAKKQIALFDGPDTVLRATANVDFEPRTSKVGCSWPSCQLV